MATVHLIHGYLGAGKTTFAKRLAAETGAIRLSADEWYLRLYVGDETTPHLDDELWRRLMALLNNFWPGLVAGDIDVVLDFGFWSRSERDEARRLAVEAGADVVLHEVVCREVDARQRCLTRNRDTRDSFIIDETAFDELRSKFEPLEADEPAETTNISPS